MRKILLALVFANSAFGAFGDKLQGTWTGAGNADEYSFAFPTQANGRRQALVACRNVTAKVSTAGNRLKVDITYNCGGGLPSGTSSFNYLLRDVAGKPCREVFEAGPPDLVVGRIFDDGLDLMEHIVDDEAGDIIGLLITLTNTRNIRLRLNWSEIVAGSESFSKYLQAPLRK